MKTYFKSMIAFNPIHYKILLLKQFLYISGLIGFTTCYTFIGQHLYTLCVHKIILRNFMTSHLTIIKFNY